MSSFFLSDPSDDFYVGRKLTPVRSFLLRVFNIALAGLLAWVVAGSAACAIRLVLNH